MKSDSANVPSSQQQIQPSFFASMFNIMSQVPFQSAFYSSAASTLFTFGLQFGFGALSKPKINPEYVQKVFEAHDKGMQCLVSYRYSEALEYMTFARDIFEQNFLTSIDYTNPRLNALYSNICYNQALAIFWCGKLSATLTQIESDCEMLKTRDPSFPETDFINLKGIIYLKNNDFDSAKNEFKHSLEKNSNQSKITFLYYHAVAMSAPTDDSALRYLQNSESLLEVLFLDEKRPNATEPALFEMDLIFLKIFSQKKPRACHHHALHLEKKYFEFNLPYHDRVRIYKLMAQLSPNHEVKTHDHEAASSLSNLPDHDRAQIYKLLAELSPNHEVKTHDHEAASSLSNEQIASVKAVYENKLKLETPFPQKEEIANHRHQMLKEEKAKQCSFRFFKYSGVFLVGGAVGYMIGRSSPQNGR